MIHPDKHPLNYFKKIADYKTTKEMERYKSLNCEVDYHAPQWIKDDPDFFEKMAKLRNRKEIFQKVVDETKWKVKPIIPKKYSFIS